MEPEGSLPPVPILSQLEPVHTSTSHFLSIQHAMCMQSATLPSVACLALQHFSTLSHKWHQKKKKFTEHNTCVLISLRPQGLTFPLCLNIM